MRIAIHQPNFMPWLPFFQKMRSVDKFILLTNCQFEKNGFQNRFNIGEDWQTMSVFSRTDLICNKKYKHPARDWSIIKRRLPQYLHILNLFDDVIGENLMQTNSQIISMIAEMLSIDTPIFFDHATELKSTDRLVELCLSHDADVYVAGPSGGTYMDLQKFKEAGIEVEFQENQTKKPILEMLDSFYEAI